MLDNIPIPKIMMRKCRHVNIQKKPGFLVEGTVDKDLKDYEKLKSAGFYVYGVRSNVGIPWTMEDSIATHNHFGYIVMLEPMIFPVRKTLTLDFCSRYFTLNNQYSYISLEYKKVNILNKKLYM